MTDKQTIDLLRFALAACWTAMESERPEEVQVISDDALRITRSHAPSYKDLTLDGTGLESWNQYKEKHKC